MMAIETPTEWKPGDVAMVRYRNSDGPEVIGICTTPNGNWRTQEHGSTFDVVPTRRLAVVDPGHGGQIDRLARAIEAHHDLGTNVLSTNDVALALEDYARPTPRIEEPQELGAVVEDDNGRRYIRQHDGWWRGPDPCTLNWTAVHAVRVLSEGIS